MRLARDGFQMCLSPIRIRNPNFHINNSGTELKDTVSAFINVPCGHCAECIHLRQSSYVQRLQMESTKNHLFFCTLTYNDESMPVISTSTGYDIRFADIGDVQKMIKRLRKSKVFGRPFRFFGVSELGSKRGRPHFHLLFLLPKYDGDDYNDCINLEHLLFSSVLAEWRRNYGSNRKPIYKPLCTYKCKFVRGKLRTNYDLHYVNPNYSENGSTDVGFYVTKYMLKPSKREERLQQALRLNLDDSEYFMVWNIVKSKCFFSLGLGLNGVKTPFGIEPDEDIVKYVRSCVDTSKSSECSPKFYNPESGQSFPLSRYYRNQFYLFSQKDLQDFNNNVSNGRSDNVIIDDTHISQKIQRSDSFKKSVAMVESHDLFEDFDDFEQDFDFESNVVDVSDSFESNIDFDNEI